MKLGTLQKIVTWCVIAMPFIPGYVMAQGRGADNWHRSPWMMGWFGPFGMLLFWTVLIVARFRILTKENQKNNESNERNQSP